MIQAIHGPLISQPQTWVLAFDPKADHWIARWTPGRYKHVRAYGYVPFLHVWLFVDANLKGIGIWVAAEGEAATAMAGEWARGCAIVLMPQRPPESGSVLVASSGWCVPFVKRLIGLRSGALRPDALFADCLRNGGTLYDQPRLPPDSDDRGRRGWRRAARWLARRRAVGALGAGHAGAADAHPADPDRADATGIHAT
jgi:hypothetical protein